MRNTSCYAFTETIESDNSFTYSCKFLKKMECDGCKWFKTYEQYNPRKVEQEMREYAEGREMEG